MLTAKRLKWTVAALVFMALTGTCAQAQKMDYQDRFLELCDLAMAQLGQDRLHIYGKHHYKDSYSIRALAVAYDMTGQEKYLDACKQWADKMVRLQDGMIPAGAYYMNYGRKPGESEGDWFVADSSSIAQAVLVTAIRCEDKTQRSKYLDSVKDFADLVIDNYMTRSGGITDGLWSKYDGPWWCSSGIFGALMFHLYYETGNEEYLEVGYGAIDWLNGQNLATTGPSTLEEQGPAMFMYTLEAYSAGLPFIETDTARYEQVMDRYEESLAWMTQHQKSQQGEDPWDYNTQWGSKGGGLPFHMYIYAKQVPRMHEIMKKANQELDFVMQGPLNEPDKRVPENKLTQLMNFTMMSLAQKLCPGAMYRR